MKVVNYKDVLPIVMDNEMVKNVAGRVMVGERFCRRVLAPRLEAVYEGQARWT